MVKNVKFASEFIYKILHEFKSDSRKVKLSDHFIRNTCTI